MPYNCRPAMVAAFQSNEDSLQVVCVIGQLPKRAKRSVSGFSPTVSRVAIISSC